MDVANPEVPRTLTFSHGFLRLRVYKPATDGTVLTNGAVGPVSSITVQVPGHVCLVQMIP